MWYLRPNVCGSFFFLSFSSSVSLAICIYAIYQSYRVTQGRQDNYWAPGQKETRLGHESNIHIKFIAERIEAAF
jgi:hypothetical protein